MYSAIEFDVFISRQEVVVNSSREIIMLLLFHVMNDRVSKVLLDCVICSQRRIDLRDELYEVTSQNANVD